MSRIRIGISGWQYANWQGHFYPEGLPQSKRLDYLAERFNTVEINGTFYSLKQPKHFREYYRQTPRDFRFAVKGGRFVTHMKRLSNVRVPLANHFASGVLERALTQGRPGFAAVDVYEDEPVLGGNHPLLRLSNALCTAHSAWLERPTYELYFGEAFDNALAYAAGRPVNLLNPEVARA